LQALPDVGTPYRSHERQAQAAEFLIDLPV
jgi:hypothetical protein